MDVNLTLAVRSAPHDQSAWDRWFKHVYPRVYYVLYRRTHGNKDISEECTQGAIERFLKYQGLQKVTSDKESVAYIARTAFNLWAERRLHDAIFTPIADEPETEPSYQSGIDARLDLDRLSSQLSKLNQELIRQLYLGQTVSEIAKLLGISYTAAGVRIHRIKDQLKKVALGM